MIDDPEPGRAVTAASVKRAVRRAAPAGGREIIGWREYVALPDLGLSEIAAKIDTGARTSALHAEGQHVFRRRGVRFVRFLVPQPGRGLREVEAPLIGERLIKNTSGVPERRRVIRTGVLLGRHHWHIEVSLADRAAMEFDIILGRTALRGRHVLVDPAHSWCAGRPHRRKKE